MELIEQYFNIPQEIVNSNEFIFLKHLTLIIWQKGTDNSTYY